MIENALSLSLPLTGLWSFHLTDAPPILLPVPGAWETHTRDKITDGPAYYSRAFTLPENWLGHTVLLEAQAVSYDCTIRLNGQLVGQHRGLWSPFQIDLTPALRPGANLLELELYKPGKRFPPRASLAGFLPDVCLPFGGIWQAIGLRALNGYAFADVWMAARASGHVTARGKIIAPAGTLDPEHSALTLSLLDSAGRELLRAPGLITADTFTAELMLPHPQLWEPRPNPPLYTAVLELTHDDQPRARVEKTIGFRDLTIKRGQTRLNAHPLHLRGVLDWGWSPQHIAPRPFALGNDLTLARDLGFNLIKLCLYLPDEAFFDQADQLGFLLWLELPLWLPHITPDFKTQVLAEYRAIFQRVHHHPSIAVISLGCELNADSDAAFLAELYALARHYFPNAFICDNSGSAEAYGGATTALADFYDYHFYTDPHFFQPLVQHFTRGYRPDKPWLYGEFCDADTLRDFNKLEAQQHTTTCWELQIPDDSSRGGSGRGGSETRPYDQTPNTDRDTLRARPYDEYAKHYDIRLQNGVPFIHHSSAFWLTSYLALDRDDFLAMRDYKRLLTEAGITDGGQELTRLARLQATLIRKFILEQVRANSATGGYVVTGWTDTPITTSGVVDDDFPRQHKFNPAEWRRFNNDCVLIIDRERRRRWIGGDRPAPKDPFTFWHDERVKIHVALSNGRDEITRGELLWKLIPVGASLVDAPLVVAPVRAGTSPAPTIPSTTVSELTTLTFQFPPVTTPTQFTLALTAEITFRDGRNTVVQNQWPLWAVPHPTLPPVITITEPYFHRHTLYMIDSDCRFISPSPDDALGFSHRETIAPVAQRSGGGPGGEVLTTDLTPELIAILRSGARALLWQRDPDPRFTRALPFWREAIHVFEPHPLWETVPHGDAADMRFFGIATDFALDLRALAELLGPEARLRPLWRRFDARKLTWAEYLIEVELGEGKLLVTTLRFEGGLGTQPNTFNTHPLGAWMLAELLKQP